MTMTGTEFLLILIFMAVLVLCLQEYYHHKVLISWLDGLGDMLADQLKTVIDTLKGKPQ